MAQNSTGEAQTRNASHVGILRVKPTIPILDSLKHVAAYRNEGVELYNPEFIWAFVPAEDVVPDLRTA